MILLMTVFRNESPNYLKEHGEEAELLAVMKKFYEPDEVQKRLEALDIELEKNVGENEVK